MNEAIDTIVDNLVPDIELRQQLKTAFLARDAEIMDQLRMAAAMNGLRPSFVALVLLQVGLGDKPTEDEVQLLMTQVAAEQAQMAEEYEAFVRHIREGGDT